MTRIEIEPEIWRQLAHVEVTLQAMTMNSSDMGLVMVSERVVREAHKNIQSALSNFTIKTNVRPFRGPEPGGAA